MVLVYDMVLGGVITRKGPLTRIIMRYKDDIRAKWTTDNALDNSKVNYHNEN